MTAIKARIDALERNGRHTENTAYSEWFQTLSVPDLRFLHAIAERQSNTPAGSPLVTMDASEREHWSRLEANHAEFLATRQSNECAD